jgi:2'-5' RNA ligase
MPSPGKHLYLIAIIPPSPIVEDIQVLKEYFSNHYFSRASLNSPPHITLHMPFEWSDAKEARLIDELLAFAIGKNPFSVSLHNYNCFKPRVIYIDVAVNHLLEELHNALHRHCKINLNLFNAKYRDLPFHPHVTLAFRDLKKEEFVKAWEEFNSKSYKASFLVDKITLLKHNGIRWEVFRDFRF